MTLLFIFIFWSSADVQWHSKCVNAYQMEMLAFSYTENV